VASFIGGYGAGLGSYVGTYTTTNTANDYGRSWDLSEYERMRQMQQNVANQWDFFRSATLAFTDTGQPKGVKYLDEDYFAKEGEIPTILQRLRRETQEFIGDNKINLHI